MDTCLWRKDYRADLHLVEEELIDVIQQGRLDRFLLRSIDKFTESNLFMDVSPNKW